MSSKFEIKLFAFVILFSNLIHSSIQEKIDEHQQQYEHLKENKLLFNGWLTRLKNSPIAEKFIDSILIDKSKNVPRELDWRKEGRVTEVKGFFDDNFTMTGLLEGQMKNFNLTLEDLSAQQIIDCLEYNKVFLNVLIELIEFGGIETAKSYPYTNKKNISCLYNKTNLVMPLNGANVAILPNDEEKLKIIVANYGPIMAGFDSSNRDFRLYKKGVYNNTNCKSTNPITILLIVGYGIDYKYGDYWLARNNFGIDWGERGYVRIARGKNICGIASYGTIITF